MTIENLAHISEIAGGIVVATTLVILVLPVRESGRREQVDAIRDAVNNFVESEPNEIPCNAHFSGGWYVQPRPFSAVPGVIFLVD